MRIYNIGLLTIPKEPLQEHQDHPTYNRVAIMRITNIGMLLTPKEPSQEHEEHPTYNYQSTMRITEIGFFTSTTQGQKQSRVSIIHRNKEKVVE